MILPITALRLAVAAAVENVTTPLPGDFPDGDVIIWRRSDEGSDNSSWLPPPLPPSFIPDKLDSGFAPDYNTRIRLPQNSTDVLTVADIAEIESMLVRLNDTTNGTSSADSEKPTERVRRSVDDEDEDDDDDNNVSLSKSEATPELIPQGESVPGYSEDAQMRPAPQMDDQTSEFFGKFLGLKSGDRAEETHEALVEPASLLQKDEEDDEQVRDRRQATPTPPVTSTSEDVAATTVPSREPTTIAPPEQSTPAVAEATTVVPLEVTTLAVTEPTTIAAPEPTTFTIPEASSEIPQPSVLPTEKVEEKPEGNAPGLPTSPPEVATEQPVPQYPSYPIQPNDFFSQGFYPPGYFPQEFYPQYPQGGYPKYPQNANPQYPQGGYPQYPQNANPQYPQRGYPQYPQNANPQYPQGAYPQYPQGAYPQYPQYPQNQQGFYPNPSGIIDPGFAPDPNRQRLQRAREEQRRQGLGQLGSHVPNGPWQGYPGGSGIIDPGFAPRPIDPLLQRDLELQRQNGGKQVPGGQQENKMTPEPHLNIVHAEGSAQGYPPNAPFGGQGAEAPRIEDTLIQQTQDQARQQQEQQRPSAPKAENVNSGEALNPAASAVAESNRE
uniref:Proline rich protein n=1 Tax=Rhipicephalus zambeziensis TaxID=60191 RepID=A0A224YPI1_9ACAR